MLALLFAAPAQTVECRGFEARSEGLPTYGEWRTHPALGDIDGDGFLDLAVYPRKMAGPKAYLWQPKTRSWKDASLGLVVPGFSCGVGVELIDLDDDEHLDLIVADHCSGIYAFKGNGGSLWQLSSSVLDRDEHGYDDVQGADLGGDGKIDLVAIGAFRGGFSVFRPDAKGALRSLKRGESGLPTRGMGSDVHIGDVNGDGLPDLAAAYAGDSLDREHPELDRNIVWLSQPDGRFVPATAGLYPPGGRSFGVALGDVNGDGLDDVAVSRDSVPALDVHLRTPEGGWKLAREGLPGNVRFHGVRIADLTGDGIADLVAAEHISGAIRIWKGDGAGKWEACEKTGLPESRDDELRSWGIEVADINGDGRNDLVVGLGRNGKGQVEAWLANP